MDNLNINCVYIEKSMEKIISNTFLEFNRFYYIGDFADKMLFKSKRNRRKEVNTSDLRLCINALSSCGNYQQGGNQSHENFFNYWVGQNCSWSSLSMLPREPL